MEPLNPYQSPGAADQVVRASVVTQPTLAGLWRQGHLLVMHRSATLPDRCVKSNQPMHGRLRRNLAWHEPWIYVTILAGLLVYIIIAIILTQRATIHIGLSEEWFRKRRRIILIGWGTVLLSVAMVVGGIAWVDRHPNAGWLILGGVVLLLVDAFYSLLAVRLVSPARIQGEYIWLKGVHPEFLAGLPPWPYR